MTQTNPTFDGLDPVEQAAVRDAVGANPQLADLPPELQEQAMAAIVEAANAKRDAARAVLHDIETRRDRIVKDRAQIEARWVEDINQYEGESTLPENKEYATSGDKDHRSGVKPKVNLTRARTNMAAARIADMLFPANDRNWDIQPLSDKIKAALTVQGQQPAPTAPVAPDQSPQPQQPGQPGQADQAPDVSASAGQPQGPAIQDSARCDAMRETIKNQLDDSWYSEHGRRMIEDGCKLGIGVLKGPVTRRIQRKKFSFSKGSDGKTVAMLAIQENRVPQCTRVDPRYFYPEPVSEMEQCERTYELHLMSRSEIKELAKQDGIDKGAAALLLTLEPTLGQVGKNLRDWNSRCVLKDSLEKKYAVWEMHGILTKDELTALGMEDLDDVDTIPVAEVWFCQGEVLRVSLSVLEADLRPPYWTWNYERADDSLYGYGVPWLYRNPQRTIDMLWLMLMHNLSVSSGPQVVVKDGQVVPVDGHWALRGPKVWKFTSEDGDVRKAFQSIDLPNNAPQIMDVLKLATDLGDEEIALPSIAQGNPNEAVPTASGLIQLLNASNIVQRRAAKSMDDEVISPMVERFYVWNMLHGDDDAVKGDFAVSARGTSVLLHKDIKAQHLQIIAQIMESNPRFAIYLKEGDFIRELFESADVSPELLLRTDQEVEKLQQQQQGNAGSALDQAKAKALQAKADLAERQAQQDQANWQREQDQQNAENRARYEQHMADLQDRAEDRQAKLLMKQMDLQANAAQLATTKDVSLAQISKDLQIAESNNQVTQFLGTMKARLQAASVAKDQQEMALKLDPANRSGTGI